MNPIQWLENNVPGFSALPEQDRQAIFHFVVLWSFFEAKAFRTRASVRAISDLVHLWTAQGRLDIEPFQPTLEYLRRRYCINGNPTEHFEGLHLL